MPIQNVAKAAKTTYKRGAKAAKTTYKRGAKAAGNTLNKVVKPTTKIITKFTKKIPVMGAPLTHLARVPGRATRAATSAVIALPRAAGRVAGTGASVAYRVVVDPLLAIGLGPMVLLREPLRRSLGRTSVVDSSLLLAYH